VVFDMNVHFYSRQIMILIVSKIVVFLCNITPCPREKSQSFVMGACRMFINLIIKIIDFYSLLFLFDRAFVDQWKFSRDGYF
jgi:hypothetical protein